MAEIGPIITPVQVKDRIATPTKVQGDPFSITGEIAEKLQPVNQNIEGKTDSAEQNKLLMELSKEILRPLQSKTTGQAEGLKELITVSKLLAYSSEKMPKDLIGKLFINPDELQNALIQKDKGATSFKGDAFDVLRMIANLNTQKTAGQAASPINQTLQNSVVNLLRHFDSYVNQSNSLTAIMEQLNGLESQLTPQEKQALQPLLARMEQLLANSTGKNEALNSFGSPRAMLQNDLKNQDIMLTDKAQIEEAQKFLKNELIPTLSKFVNLHQQSGSVRDPVTSIIHYVARFDKADPARLSGAYDNLAENLSKLSNLSTEDINELRNLIFDAARELRTEQKVAMMDREFLANYGVTDDDNDILNFISKSLDDGSPARVQKLALNLLGNLLDSESPVMPLLHYMIPVKWKGSEGFLEMYIDKNGSGKKGKNDGGNDGTVNIFFTVQSDDYGTFEVDLLAKDKMIDLDIKAPTDLFKAVKGARTKMSEGIEQSGYRLAGYKVGVYKEGKTAAAQFPLLYEQRMGIDIKI